MNILSQLQHLFEDKVIMLNLFSLQLALAELKLYLVGQIATAIFEVALLFELSA
jgi:hypothetical protein